MEASPRELLVCQDRNGHEPFRAWIESLDVPARARIRVRLDRVEDGNFGDVRSVGEGVSELRIDFGPGFRVYFGQFGAEVHLICGGSKQTQDSDIEFAIRFWREHE
jgi:putative addiction module killer protein